MRRMGLVGLVAGAALVVGAPGASAGVTFGWVGPFSDQASCEVQREITMEYYNTRACEYRDVSQGSGWYFRIWYYS